MFGVSVDLDGHGKAGAVAVGKAVSAQAWASAAGWVAFWVFCSVVAFGFFQTAMQAERLKHECPPVEATK